MPIQNRKKKMKKCLNLAERFSVTKDKISVYEEKMKRLFSPFNM